MRTQAKEGDTIRIIEMKGEPRYTGKIGTVEHVDSIGQIELWEKERSNINK